MSGEKNVSANKTWSSTRWMLVYLLSLLITPVMLMPFIPGTHAFRTALVVFLATHASVGVLVARAMLRGADRRPLQSAENKLLIVSVTTTALCVIALASIVLLPSLNLNAS